MKTVLGSGFAMHISSQRGLATETHFFSKLLKPMAV